MYDPDTLYVAFSAFEGQPVFCYALRVVGIDSIENKLKKTEIQTLT